MRLVLASIILATTTFSTFAASPEGAKLSEIIAKIEQSPDFQYLDEVDWNDRGYYEIEYYMKNDAKVQIKIDPKTGDTIK